MAVAWTKPQRRDSVAGGSEEANVQMHFPQVHALLKFLVAGKSYPYFASGAYGAAVTFEKQRA